MKYFYIILIIVVAICVVMFFLNGGFNIDENMEQAALPFEDETARSIAMASVRISFAMVFAAFLNGVMRTKD